MGKSILTMLNAQPSAGQPARQTAEARLTQRQLQILFAILSFGGVLTTKQIATYFFPPDLKRRLIGWGIPGQQAEAWLSQHAPDELHAKLECLKWCQQLIKLHDLPTIKRRIDVKLTQWVQALRTQQPVVYMELEETLNKIATTPIDWLIQAVEQKVKLPQAFALRPRLPSETVSSACKVQLRYLKEADLIEPVEQAVRLVDGRLPLCWFLTRLGRNKVAQVSNMSPKDLEWKSPGAYGQFHLAHRLALNDFRIAVTLACQHRGYTIRRWIDDNELKRLLAQEKVALRRRVTNPQTQQAEEIQEVQALKIPDGFFWLDLGNGREQHCFFEYDNQTLTLDYADTSTKDFSAKIRTLGHWYRAGRYKELFPEAGERMWMLTVTSGSTVRLNNLMATTKQVIGPNNKALDRYWFTCAEQIRTLDDYFSPSVFEPIWLRAGQDRLWALDEVV